MYDSFSVLGLVPGAQQGIFDGRGQVHIKRHTKNSSSNFEPSNFKPLEEYSLEYYSRLEEAIAKGMFRKEGHSYSSCGDYMSTK